MRIPIALSIILLCSGTVHGAYTCYKFAITPRGNNGWRPVEFSNSPHICMSEKTGIHHLTTAGIEYLLSLPKLHDRITCLFILTQLTSEQRHKCHMLDNEVLTIAWTQCFSGNYVWAYSALFRIIVHNDTSLLPMMHPMILSFAMHYGRKTIKPYLPEEQQHLCGACPSTKPIKTFTP